MKTAAAQHEADVDDCLTSACVRSARWRPRRLDVACQQVLDPHQLVDVSAQRRCLVSLSTACC